MENNINLSNPIIIENRIFNIRGMQVMIAATLQNYME